MDINDLRGLSTVLVMVAFLGIVYWAYVRKNKRDFDEAANLPFADDEETSGSLGAPRDRGSSQ